MAYTTLVFDETTQSAVPADFLSQTFDGGITPVTVPPPGLTPSSTITGLVGGTYPQDAILGTGNIPLVVSKWNGGTVAITGVQVIINPIATTPSSLGVYFFTSTHTAVTDKSLKTTSLTYASDSDKLIAPVFLDLSHVLGDMTVWSTECNIQLNTLTASSTIHAMVFAETANVLNATSVGKLKVFTRHV